MIAQCRNRYGEPLKRPRQKGAAMVEFAMVAGLLVFLFASLLEVSRVLNEYTWIVNTAYQIAGVFSGNHESVGLVRANMRRTQIVDDYRRQEFPSLGLYDVEFEPLQDHGFGGEYYHPDQRLVGLSFKAKIALITSVPLSLPLKITVTAPYLITDQPANLGEPTNPNPLLNCCGELGYYGDATYTTVNGRYQCKTMENLCEGSNPPCAGTLACAS